MATVLTIHLVVLLLQLRINFAGDGYMRSSGVSGDPGSMMSIGTVLNRPYGSEKVVILFLSMSRNSVSLTVLTASDNFAYIFPY